MPGVLATFLTLRRILVMTGTQIPDQSSKKLLTFLQTKSSQKANLPHKTIESGRDLGVSYELLLFFVDLPPVSGRATVMFS